jgi:adenine deaminase
VANDPRLPAGALPTQGAGGQRTFLAEPAFLAELPKAELHLHLEGTLEPQLRNTLAARNQLPLTPVDKTYTDLTSFLAAYYAAMDVLRTEQDFYDLAMAYFRRAAAEHVVYAEVFFDPQAHTSRGVPFQTVIDGIDRARADAPLDVQLIMCFLRDKDAADAMRTLEQAAPYRSKIAGVGLDSDERGNPPVKFKDVFAAARDEGYHLTMHCDVDQQDSVRHIWQCLDEIGVERIDHGVNCLEDAALVGRLAREEMGLTVCPISNRWVTDGLKAAELKSMLDHGLKVTVNSDDPAYFSGYITENFVAVAQAAGLTQQEVEQLARNAFDISWR